MAKDSDPLAGAFETKETGGILAGLLAEENEFDRRMMWRLGTWGVGAVGAVIIAVLANQAQLGWRRDQLAAADVARQAERLQALSKESQNEARRLASAIETLNNDRDRLYSRVTTLEQGLDSVTGAIARQAAKPQPASSDPQLAVAPQPPASPVAAPSVAPVASTAPAPADKPRAEAIKDQAAKEPAKEPARDQPSKDLAAKDPPALPPQTAAAASLMSSAASSSALPTIPLVASKSIMAPPDPAAAKLVQPDTPAQPQAEAAVPAKQAEASEEEAAPQAITVQQTRFALDLGSASSIDGLRAMWRGVIKSNPEIGSLRPIMMIKEGKTGLGMQLRLGAGPLVNAAAAAKYCAALIENGRACETTVFDGQRLSLRGQDSSPQAETAASNPAKSDARSETKSGAKSEPKADAKPEARFERHRRSYSSKRTKHEEPAPPPPPAAKPETTSTLSSFFRRQ